MRERDRFYWPAFFVIFFFPVPALPNAPPNTLRAPPTPVYPGPLALVPPYLTKTLVDDILVTGNNHTSQIELFGSFGMSAVRALIAIGIAQAAILVIRHGLGAVRGYYLRKAGDRIVKDLRDDVYEHAQHLPM